MTVTAEPASGGAIEAHARDLGESDSFQLGVDSRAAEGWRLLVRGAAAELREEGIELRPCRLTIAGDLPRGAGLSSSAALTVALCLALCEVAGARAPDPIALARLCSRVENDWSGAQTGLLDQLACAVRRAGPRGANRHARPGHPRPCRSSSTATCWPCSTRARPHDLAAGSGYNERREECREACRALGIDSLRDATSAEGLPEPLDRRVRHVISENARVDRAVAALGSGDLAELGALLDASHASLRDDYEVSVPEVERAVDVCKRAGALGARIMGGGFGGSVLALFGPGAKLPPGAVSVEPGPAARLL